MKKTTSRAAHNSLFIEKLPGYFLISCLLIALGYMIYILSPFLTVIFIAAVLAITFNPVYKKILSKMPKWPGFASILSCFLVVLMTVVPLLFFTVMISNEGQSAYETIKESLETGEFDEYLVWEDGGIFYDHTKNFVGYVESYVDLDDLDLKQKIIGGGQDLSSWLVTQLTAVFASFFNFLMNFMFMLFAMYYFFKDGDKIVQKLAYLSPLPAMHEEELFKKVGSMVNAIVIGVFLTAVVQGVVGGIGFAIVGISSPGFWGTAMALFSLVPLVGTAVIWVPAVIVLLILGAYGKALFILLWGVIAIGSVDNILRPYLIGGKAHTYPLLTFFVILGGIFVMGFKGIIVGPLVLMILMSILHIYEVEYKQVLKR